ncbi:MAG: uL4 family ribosomal protein [Candidatus Hodgkinia cicadicola]|nr:MAG: uL4 family ribosomal protein [Candidatus Hodgkinia cicadicola]
MGQFLVALGLKALVLAVRNRNVLVARTETDIPVWGLKSNFEICPRIDLISSVARWQLDKRRWHVAKIKSRSDVSCSNKKRYAQKGTGRARHATASVCQFRGGGKYAAEKACVSLQLNKKLKRLAFKSCLSIKRASGCLFVVESFLHSASWLKTKTVLVYDNSLVGELPLLLRNPNITCVHWSSLKLVQTLCADALVFSVRAIKMVGARLAQKLP